MLILILEDHKAIRDMLKMALVRDRHEVLEAEDVASAKRLVLEEEPDLVIADWMLPDVSGIEYIRWLRRQVSVQTTPVLMLTAKSQDKDTITGLDAGADDYMSKPVAIPELLARIRALGRRPKQYDSDVHLIEAGPIHINTAVHQVRINGHYLSIQQTDYRLLCFFVKHPERVWSRTQILDRVWGRAAFVDERTVDVHILRLRKLLKPMGVDRLIITVRGLGYRLSPEEMLEQAV